MGDFTRLIINRFTPKSAAFKIQNKNILGKKKIVPRESTETVGEVLLQWSHRRIWTTKMTPSDFGSKRGLMAITGNKICKQ